MADGTTYRAFQAGNRHTAFFTLRLPRAYPCAAKSAFAFLLIPVGGYVQSLPELPEPWLFGTDLPAVRLFKRFSGAVHIRGR